MDLVDVLSWILLVSGAVFCMIGGLGLIRLPDFYSRMHGGGITDTLGAGLIIAGLMVQSGLSMNAVKLAIILILLWTTSPTATHALAKAAHASGLKPWRREKDGGV
jgi:multicomponent Na+:H+ antiporter subunit G